MGYHRWLTPVRTWQGVKPRANAMRRKPTLPESALWNRLRDRQIGNATFRQQHGIGPYLADFYCAEAKLVVEVDGDVHEQPGAQAHDAERDANLAASGILTLRFRNEAVLADTESVLADIATVLAIRRTSSCSPFSVCGEGGWGDEVQSEA